MLVQVYGDNAMKKTAVYKWVKSFSEGRENVTDEERSGWPATSRTEENIAKVHQWSQRSSLKNKSKEDFLATKQITVLEHPAYSPDLAPNDFFSVPKDNGNIERKAF